MKLIIINGPNLNLLGTRETSVYGNQTFEEYFKNLQNKFSSIGLIYYQSNVEGAGGNSDEETSLRLPLPYRVEQSFERHIQYGQLKQV